MAETKTDDRKDILVKRLKRLEGQLRGIQKMIDADRNCVDIIMQLAAVRSGVEGVGAIVLKNCMNSCLRQEPTASADVTSLSRAISVWGRVRSGDDV